MRVQDGTFPSQLGRNTRKMVVGLKTLQVLMDLDEEETVECSLGKHIGKRRKGFDEVVYRINLAIGSCVSRSIETLKK